ncbi:aldehyde dehydrogenase [Xylaria cf. heliscus]|nr:aldehyde dehydrogenase [Xylaria cf. heliscus]
MAVNVDSSLPLPTLYDVNQTPHSTPLRGSTPASELLKEPVVEATSHGITRLTFASFQNVIDGELSSTEQTRHTINPSTLEANPEVPVSTRHDLDRAVAAAQVAAEAWAKVPWDERRKAVEAFADALEAHVTEFSHILVREMGLPIATATHEVNWGIEWVRDFCKLSLPEKVIDASRGGHVIERYTPIGVAAGIVPWNGPVILGCGKIAPAMLTGNALILKPSPFAPYAILKMAELGLQFFPRGVLQALSGEDDIGPWMTSHPGIGKISFTGSCATGKRVMQSCSAHLKRVTLELGGNDPAIICEDVDPATVAKKIGFFALLRTGQLCMAVKRAYVHEKVYDAVLAELVKHFETVKVGDGFDEDTVVGPICNEPQYERVKELFANIEETKLDFRPRNSPSIKGLKGFFIQPTIVANPPEDSRVVVEEPFGPILPVMKWSDEADVIRRANNTDYGLGASVWSKDLTRADRIANQLQAGNIWINTHAELQASTAFVCHKQSGLGSELGVEGLKGWCNIQAVYTRAFS